MGLFAQFCLLTLFLCLSFPLSTAAQRLDEAEVPAFARELTAKLQPGAWSAEEALKVVIAKRVQAEKALVLLEELAERESSESEPPHDSSIWLVVKKVQVLLNLTDKNPKCSDGDVTHMLGLVNSYPLDDDKIFLVDRLSQLCPRNGEALARLGMLYLSRDRCGMAVQACEQAVELTGRPDVAWMLKTAQECLEDHKKPAFITPELLRSRFEGTLPRGIKNYAELKRALTAPVRRRVHFDEWSSGIAEGVKRDLDVLGQAIKREFDASERTGLLIEGHTDHRGPEAKNEKLSLDRAEAVKQYLVTTFGLDPARIRAVGYGPHRPMAPFSSEDALSLNRRVEFKRLDLPPKPQQ
jgi:outer membrane protein OmpA-like peptidoglycan-associated protein